MDLNRFTAIGRLTKDPEKRDYSGGNLVIMSLAINSREREETCYIDVVAFGRTADACAEHLGKGSQVCVDGRLRLERWEDRDGNRRSKHSVTAQSVQFLASPGARQDRGKDRGQDRGQGRRDRNNRQRQRNEPVKVEYDHEGYPPDDEPPF